MWLLIAFLVVPLIEIGLFIQVGGLIGLWPTLAIVVVTAFLGTWLVRSQGASALAELRSSFETLRDPSEPLAHGAMILVAGALLLTPGFFTDAVGFALLTPPVRRAAFRWAKANIKVQKFEARTTHDPRRPQPQPRRPHQDDVIEGEFTEVGPDKKPTHPGSGWTRH
ncbi:FxsA family protein [Litorisediminicola beolgyonensis]|uniref:FxsA family protein n=1 Tax=Litorisediminicola beolgyonensis TaxID=1173614 RepID=A0ABW3ZDY2_9RHOB